MRMIDDRHDQLVRWEEYGIPEGFAFPTIYLDSTFKFLVLRVTSTEPDKQSSKSRILFKTLSEQKYRPISNSLNEVSCGGPLFHPLEPKFYILTTRWFNIDGNIFGNWEGLHSFDMLKEEIITETTGEDIVLGEGCSRLWFIHLLSFNADQHEIILTAGIERNIGRSRRTVDHWICAYNLHSKSLTKMQSMGTPFF